MVPIWGTISPLITEGCLRWHDQEYTWVFIIVFRKPECFICIWLLGYKTSLLEIAAHSGSGGFCPTLSSCDILRKKEAQGPHWVCGWEVRKQGGQTTHFRACTEHHKGDWEEPGQSRPGRRTEGLTVPYWEDGGSQAMVRDKENVSMPIESATLTQPSETC